MGKRKKEILSVFHSAYDLDKVDPSTNLIELPENYFWRIDRSYGTFFLSLMYRKSGPSFWDRSVIKVKDINLYTEEMHSSNVISGPSGIRYECRVVLSKVKAKDDPYSVIIGDYPPKRMEWVDV